MVTALAVEGLLQHSNLGYTQACFHNFHQVTTTGFYYVGGKDLTQEVIAALNVK
ncbi:MAG: hypothetical protein IJX10_04075 [Phascolarctobacterium sp.]|nr:hypothetical protein [Phascolarctobacterium sp.]